jgi:hypothetical protein
MRATCRSMRTTGAALLGEGRSMMRSGRIGRKLASALAVAGLSCGLAAAAAPAQAAVPNVWGYALVLKVSGPVAPAEWRESVPSPVPTAAPGLPGQEFVTFPNIGFKQGVVHVTAIIDELAWCQAQSWHQVAGNEVVAVRCYIRHGVPTFVPFTVMFTDSSGTAPGGLQYAYVHDSPTGIVSSFNSTGLTNTVTPGPAGVWLVRLNGAGPATQSGAVQVTAVNATKPAICDVGGLAWTATQQIIQVRCYTALGAPLKTGWNLTYQRGRAITGAKPKLFAYTFNNKPLVPGPYAPAPPAVNFNSAGGVNMVRRSGIGSWLITFPRVAAFPNTVLVSTVSAVPRVCNLNTVWFTSAGTGVVTVRDVACYTVSGAFAPTKSFVTYTR